MTWFALASYKSKGTSVPAVVVDGKLYDLKSAAKAAKVVGIKAEWFSGGVQAIMSDWKAAGPVLRKAGPAIAKLAASGRLTSVGAGDKIAIAPYRPKQIFCAASNFIEHANEMTTVLAAKCDSKPYMFLKLQNTVIGPRETVRKPAETEMLDWEVELAVVIGKRARRVSADKALQYVAGYSIVNDVTARDLNKRADYPFKFDWFQGKCHDTFAPFGPWIVPSWLIRDPQDLNMKLTVNGKIMQDDSTKNMIWTVREQIAYLSTIVTLEPGDVIATGTPAGVGMGRGIYLKNGDVMEAALENIGSLRNPVAAEKI